MADATAGELVGILGGMGPAATADFYAKLIRRTPATRDQDHLRVAIWADPTVPDRVGAVFGSSPDPFPAMLDGANRLRGLGATVVAMPCHTAHVYRARLAAATGLPFVDMVGETVSALLRQPEPVRTVGLLATRGTLHSGLYQDRCAAEGIDTRTPTEAVQQRVDEAILHVKRDRPAEAGAPLLAAVRHLGDAGASVVILACTELPLALPADRDAGLPPVLDPTDVLAAAVVRACRGAESP